MSQVTPAGIAIGALLGFIGGHLVNDTLRSESPREAARKMINTSIAGGLMFALFWVTGFFKGN